MILQQIVYDAYGILLSGSAGNAAIPVLYRGERFDGTLQNYYLRARYFNPSTGAFNQVDQFTGVRILPSTLNKYVYTSSDPMNHLDPSGNIQIGLIISLSIVGFLTAASLWYMSLSEGAFHDIDRSSGGATKYDVASELVAIRNFTLQQANATPRVKEKAKEEIESVIGIFRNLMMGNTAGAGNWDISGLNFTHSPLNDKTQAVSVGNAVFEKGEVNYWILGVWAKIADIELARLEQSITEYRLFKNSPDAGPSSVPGRIGWLRAGYHGDFKYASRFSYPNAQVSNAKYAGPFEFHIGSFRGILHNGTIKQK